MDVPTRREPCPSCSFVFWVPVYFHNARQEDHKVFYCPACKETIYYPQQSDLEVCQDDADKLTRQLTESRAHARSLREENAATERRRISQKAATTRLRMQLNELKEKPNG